MSRRVTLAACALSAGLCLPAAGCGSSSSGPSPSTGATSGRWTQQADGLCAKTLRTLSRLAPPRTPTQYVRNLSASLLGYEGVADAIRGLSPAPSDPRVAGMLDAMEVRVKTLEKAQVLLGHGKGVEAASKAIASHHPEMVRGATFAFELGLNSCGSLITPR
jgi:hypothetical protein